MNKIFRRLPHTHLAVKGGLNTANSKQLSNPPGPQVLKAETATQLAAKVLAFNNQYNATVSAQAVLNNYTPVKAAARDKNRQFCSQFMHSIEFEIQQGVLTPADRAFYTMDISTGNFLPMSSEAELKLTADALIQGEAARVEAGGTPIAYPLVAVLIANNTDFLNKVDNHSNLTDALDIEQEKLNVLTTDAIKFIKKLWNEIESTFSAETIESRRENSRPWGVVYALVSEKITVSLTVVDAVTGLPIAEADALLVQANLALATDAAGKGEFRTPIIGEDTLRLEAQGYVLVEMPIDTSEAEPLSIIIEMQRVA